jgi:hypothetical protein
MISTKQVADAVGVSAQRILQMARARGIEPAARIGQGYAWNAADLPRFERRPAGRPRSHT